MRHGDMSIKWHNRLMIGTPRLRNWSSRSSGTTREPGWCLRSRWHRGQKDPSLTLSLMGIALNWRDSQMSEGKFSKRTRSSSLQLMSSMRTWHTASRERTSSCSSCTSSSRWATPYLKSLKERSRMCRQVDSPRTSMMSTRSCTPSSGKKGGRQRKKQNLSSKMASLSIETIF